MKNIVIAVIALIIGAAIGVFAYSRIVPVPHDAIARGEAFEPENRDWFFQHAREVFPTRTVARSTEGQPLPAREGALHGFTYEWQGQTRTLADLYTDMETAGLIILYQGQVVHESYGRGSGPGTQFASFSMVKSITSTLVGFAVHDGLIESVDDPLVDYLPDLAGTAYDGVTIKQALQMSSGVGFDMDARGSVGQDTIDFITNSMVLGKESAFDIARSFPRAAEPGTVFKYNTAESQILLELVRQVTGKSAAKYLEEKMWQPLGMDHDAGWIIDYPSEEGAEIGGAFFNGSLRDWARFGLFIEQDGFWNGEQLLPEDWVQRATTSDAPHLMPGAVWDGWTRGYGWHWWTFPDGAFTASGANGQSIYVNQQHDLVVARASAWPEGYVPEYDQQTMALYDALKEWFPLPSMGALPPPETEAP